MELRGFNPPRAGGLKLHLGCGRTHLEGWVNVDSVELPGVDQVLDLNICIPGYLPYEENSVDEFLMSHVIEHIPRTLPLMQELHRVAKPDAECLIRCPYGSSDDAWEDPTHVRAYFIQSFGYFSQPFYWRADYGFRGDWQPERMQLLVGPEYNGAPYAEMINRLLHERNVVREMLVWLRAVKPIREPKKELQRLPQIQFTAVES